MRVNKWSGLKKHSCTDTCVFAKCKYRQNRILHVMFHIKIKGMKRANSLPLHTPSTLRAGTKGKTVFFFSLDCMRGSREFCQRESNLTCFFFLFFLADEGREDPNTTISGSSSSPCPPSGSAHEEVMLHTKLMEKKRTATCKTLSLSHTHTHTRPW